MNVRHKGRIVMAAALLAAALPCAAARHALPGRYSLELDGWRLRSTPVGEVFVCDACAAPVQVQISYGPELPADASGPADNDAFLARLDDEATQRQFAELMLGQSLPPDAPVDHEIEAVRKVRIGGLAALEYVAVLATQPRASREDAMLAVHQGRLMKLTLNFYDGGLNNADSARVGKLLKSLKFN